MNLEEGFELAIQDEKLIHGVLKKLGIWQNNPSYQDYLQEGFIIYARAYVDYCKRNDNLEKFNVYVYQKLRWRILDLMRQNQRFEDNHELGLEIEQSTEIDNLELDFTSLDLTKIETIILTECFYNGKSLTELAKILKCSDRNLRYHRDKLRQKIIKDYQCVT
ncbi:sigma-70 family RNA polymerase sigma factor [Companilactobacillus metriopterae]|uniref:sigma-70 family RNA polymerase sigma factor n=1 Tax=Companilactobacillus metriopterae TaxID=1909267 RepID=UPI00100C0ECD|nr:sigma-70 family RNA polymerase sigma factor [Companilactobacillus metriopterae]